MSTHGFTHTDENIYIRTDTGTDTRAYLNPNKWLPIDRQVAEHMNACAHMVDACAHTHTHTHTVNLLHFAYVSPSLLPHMRRLG